LKRTPNLPLYVFVQGPWSTLARGC
jgi:hypothetical protein